MSTNMSNATEEPSSSLRDEKLASVEIGTLSVILVLAVTSNLTMLIAIWRQRRNRPLSRMYFFMMHLSLADLLVALFNILPQLAWDITYRFQGGDVLCRFVKYAQVMTLYLSTYILMFMAVDRYRAVCCRNLHWNSLKVAKCFVAASWAMAILFSIPQAVIFHEEEISVGVTDCWVQFVEPWGAKAYVTWFVVSIFGAPLLVIGVCYGVICRQIWIYSQSALPSSQQPPTSSAYPAVTSETGSTLSVMRRWILRASLRWQKSRSSSNGTKNHSANANTSQLSDTIPMRSLATQPASNPLSAEAKVIRSLPPPLSPQCCQQMPLRRSNSNQNRITKAKMKTIKLTLAVVLCFVACWAPFCITQLIMVYCPPTSQADVSPVAVIILLLASLNSCSNPWIYLAFSGSLLNQMRVCLGLRWVREGQDKDSIGEDDRRGVLGPAGGQLPNTNHRFGRGQRQTHTRDQRKAMGVADELLPTHERLPVVVTTKCCRADVVTHLGKARKLQTQQQLQQEQRVA